jgi:hypothetical protein
MAHHQMRGAIVAGLLLSMSIMTGPAAADDCPFDDWLTYKDVPLRKNDRTGAYLYVTAHAAVDADGAPNAYHQDDVGKPCGSTGAGLDCPANAGYPNSSWWPSVLARDPANPDQAYVQASGPHTGFFVSKTALFDRTRSSEQDTRRYVDATAVPYLVFPRPFHAMRGTGKLGDLGVAYHLDTKMSTPFVVADIGPDEPLGEASIALFEALGGKDVNPRNGRGVAAGQVLYIVFPYSADERPVRWPVGNEQVAQLANDLLSRVGGTSMLEACATRE